MGRTVRFGVPRFQRDIAGVPVARWCVVLLLAVAGSASPASAQARAALVGVVRDSAGNPVPGAEVRLIGDADAIARTNDSGGFRLAALRTGPASFRFRRMGFLPATVNLVLRGGQTDSLVLALTMTTVSLATVLVEDEYLARSHRLLPGFWDRRSRGFGNYMTRDEIEKREPREFVDIVRLMPGVTIQTRSGRAVIRFNRGSQRTDCPPQYFVDGMRIDNMSPDEMTPQDVEAIEVYAGPATTPPQFAPRPNTLTCGAVVIWTRLPG